MIKMYPACSTLDLSSYDFSSQVNDNKWKGLFLPAIKKVSQQVQVKGYSLQGQEASFLYIEKLILNILGLLLNRPSPTNIQEIQERIQKILPPPVDRWAIDEATTTLNQGKKKTIEIFFPVDKIHSLLQKEVLQHKIDHNLSLFISAVLQYIAADILHLVGKYVIHSRHAEFTVQDIKAAIVCDKVLCDLFQSGDTLSFESFDDEEPIDVNSLSYNEVVDDFLHSERQYLRSLQMLDKVFGHNLVIQLSRVNKKLEKVFSCVEELIELTISLISIIEDILEMNEPNQVPSIGICLMDLAESWEFDVYDTYAEEFNEKCKMELGELLRQHDIEAALSTAGHGYGEAVKFYFPNLLLEPFHHFLQYFEFIKILDKLTPHAQDKTDLLQTNGVLTSLKAKIEALMIPKKITGDLSLKLSSKGNKQIARQKGLEIKDQVDGFVEEIGQSYFNEFFFEGDLTKVIIGKKPSERHGYLFDGCLILCKQNSKKTLVGLSQHEYRLKETYYLTKVEVRDKEDVDEWKNLFEICPKGQVPIIYSTRTYEEKANWMAALVMLTTKSMLDRLLDRILSDEKNKHPLKLPSSDNYRFAVPDSDSNLIFDKNNGNSFLIKGATLLKLIERLTHHLYSDPNFVNTFLTTYRSFCTTHEFLELLIERFNIPDPEFELEEAESIQAREMLKKFRKEYVRHVQLRVLNVMKQWVSHHFYDFERDPTLQYRLEEFLEASEASRGKNSIFESVRRCLRKAVENVNADTNKYFTDTKSPPPIEYHIQCPVSEWNILTIHPIEFARQLTILEFDYYRLVRPSELVGSVWTKRDKEKSSPNLLRMIKHTTNVTRWFEKSILWTDNLEERVAVLSRILEVMIVLQELNNFNGVLSVVSAMGSASVHRLTHTFQNVSPKLLKALEDAQELQNDHYKKYQEKLRSINPPCVPFFGMYLSNILHIEEGNRDFLPNSPDLINFSKRRKVAEITSEIRQFQYSHYVLSVESRIREFIETLQPFDLSLPENEISNILYNRSLDIEPRGAKVPNKFSRKWSESYCKSPGIKPRHLAGKSHPAPLSLSLHSSTATLNSSRLEDIDSSSSTNLNSCVTPKTLTPSSVPPSSSYSPSISSPHNDFSIFVPVLIGQVPNTPPGGVSCSNKSSIHNVNYNTSLPNTQPYKNPPLNPPPPLPPRRNRDESSSDSSNSHFYDSSNHGPPPPLPPRKMSGKGVVNETKNSTASDSGSQSPTHAQLKELREKKFRF